METPKITPEDIQQAREFRKIWNQFVNSNRRLLYHMPQLKMTKAIAWNQFKREGQVDFLAAMRKVGEVITSED